MKAIAVYPGRKDSVHLADLPTPSLDEIAHGRGVLVRLLRCGVDGTDKEINAAEYGVAPDGFDFLTIGHENFGRVEAIGSNVTEFSPGDYVVATVRRKGSSIYDQIGTYDMTTDEVYFERGVSRRHGYLTEYYVDHPEYIVKVPDGLRDIAVIAEPLSVAEKGIIQAYEIQRRLKVWQPRKAAVVGSGTIGLLATLILRLRGVEVTAFARTPKPYLNSELMEAIGARYVSTRDMSVRDAAQTFGPFDLIYEATGFAPIVFEAMEALGKNGVLVLASVTGGDQMVEVPAARINLEFVLGNKVMVGTVNGNREYFEAAIRDLAMAEAQYPGWAARLLTHPVQGLDNYRQLIETLTSGNNVIKAYCEIAPLDAPATFDPGTGVATARA
ncbi:MAG: glucose 1-dehydrogenase [Chloroflexi bacterium]|nr:glucose 1-dehydrogenase [Chloroflexota bacterium]MBV9601366.1 glucose 1-dehydrogenase [Chloroflexota bacterium]